MPSPAQHTDNLKSDRRVQGRRTDSSPAFMHDLVTATVTIRGAQPADSVCVEGGQGMVLCAGSGGEATVDHDPKVANTTRRWSLSRRGQSGLGCLSRPTVCTVPGTP